MDGDDAYPPEGALTGLARTETTPLVMLLAILALTAVILLGVAIEHPVTAPFAIGVFLWLGVVVRALVRRVRTPRALRGPVPPARDHAFAKLVRYSDGHPVIAVVGFVAVSGGTALEIGVHMVVDHRSAESLIFAAGFAAVAALGGLIVGIYQVRRARRER